MIGALPSRRASTSPRVIWSVCAPCATARRALRCACASVVNKAWLNIKSVELGYLACRVRIANAARRRANHARDTCAMACWKRRATMSTMDGWLFEIDEFLGDNSGLIVAEIELPCSRCIVSAPRVAGARSQRSGALLQRQLDRSSVRRTGAPTSVTRRCERSRQGGHA